MTNRDGTIAAGLFLLAWVTFLWFFGGAGWNQDAHFDLTRSLVERQTFFIDGYDVNTGDVSPGTEGHTYINKPPGASIVAAVPYAFLYRAETALHLSADRLARENAWITTALSCGLCGALIGPILYLYARRRFRTTPMDALQVAALIAFGTIVFPYSTMLFAHVPAALFLLLAVTLAEERPFLAGMAAGAAVSCFYVCALAAIILALFAFAAAWRRGMRFTLGTLPFAAAMAVYQWICFGSPLRTTTEASTRFTDKHLLLGVLQLPKWEALYGITFSPYRGLFFASPVLLSAIAGCVTMGRTRGYRRELTVVISSIALFILAIAAFNGWSGGWAFGPRYLLPVVPLFAIPMFFAVPRGWPLRLVWIGAAVLSVGIHFLATATDATPSPELHDPIRRYLVPAFFKGRIPEKTRRAFPWYDSTHVDKVSLPREAGNVGELMFGEGKRASVVPIALWLLIGGAILFRLAGASFVEEGRAP